MVRLLIAMSETSTRRGVSNLLARNPEYQVQEAADYPGALQAIGDTVFDLILSDVRLPGATAAEVMNQVRTRNGSAVVLVIAGLEDIDTAVQAIKLGAYGIVRKPVNPAELDLALQRALEVRRLQAEAQFLRGERNLYYKTDYFVGQSPQIKRVFEVVNKVARARCSVVLVGETGTGKELLAGAIHYCSDRADKAFVRVNCAALPDQLLESELFGHERGAFTGAERLRIGRFEQADGGSIFLDEIGDMRLATQAKVLRVVQEGEFQRLGHNRTIRVNVRVISATNRDLQAMVRAGQFRDDLYFRLHVVTVRVPPLREREGDVRLLADFFVRKCARDLKKHITSIDGEAMQMLLEHSWPGNVRELQNTMERAVILAETPAITRHDLELRPPFREPCPEPPPRADSIEEEEKRLILQALQSSNWVQSRAARLLGVSRRVMNYKIQKLGLTHPRWRRNV